MQQQNDPNKEAGQNKESQSSDYKRDGVQLGGDATNPSDPNAGTQKGGGGTGYDVDREQNEVNKQQEEMQQERDLDQVQPERTPSPQPEITPGPETPSESPGQTPHQPDTRPGTSTMGNLSRTNNGGWSQSSWDSNSMR